MKPPKDYCYDEGEITLAVKFLIRWSGNSLSRQDAVNAAIKNLPRYVIRGCSGNGCYSAEQLTVELIEK